MILYIDLRLQCSFVVFLVLVFSECRDCLCRLSSTSNLAFDRLRQSTFVCESASGLSLSFSVHTCHVTDCRLGGVESFFDQQVCIRRSSQPIGGRSTTDSLSQQTFVCLWPPYAFERACVPFCVVFCQSDSQMSQVLSKRLVYLAHMCNGAEHFATVYLSLYCFGRIRHRDARAAKIAHCADYIIAFGSQRFSFLFI